MAVARLGDRRVQPQPAVRPLHRRAARRRPAAGRDARPARSRPAFHRNQVRNTEGGHHRRRSTASSTSSTASQTTATVFLGLTMQCARCHDHKYDPVTQKEFYQFFAFFNSVAEKAASYGQLRRRRAPFVRVPSADQQRATGEGSTTPARRAGEASSRNARPGPTPAVAAWEKALTPRGRGEADGGRAAAPRAAGRDDRAHAVRTSVTGLSGTVRGNAKWAAGKVGRRPGAATGTPSSRSPAGRRSRATPRSRSASGRTRRPDDLLALASKMDDGAAHRGWDMLLEGGKVSVAPRAPLAGQRAQGADEEADLAATPGTTSW